MLVKLHRPPPEIRIFLPVRAARSSTTTRLPRFPASMAHIRPAAPPPRIITSKSCFTISDGRAPAVTAPAEEIGNPTVDRSPGRPSLPNADERTAGWPHEAPLEQFGALR